MADFRHSHTLYIITYRIVSVNNFSDCVLLYIFLKQHLPMVQLCPKCVPIVPLKFNLLTNEKFNTCFLANCLRVSVLGNRQKVTGSKPESLIFILKRLSFSVLPSCAKDNHKAHKQTRNHQYLFRKSP